MKDKNPKLEKNLHTTIHKWLQVGLPRVLCPVSGLRVKPSQNFERILHCKHRDGAERRGLDERDSEAFVETAKTLPLYSSLDSTKHTYESGYVLVDILQPRWSLNLQSLPYKIEWKYSSLGYRGSQPT